MGDLPISEEWTGGGRKEVRGSRRREGKLWLVCNFNYKVNKNVFLIVLEPLTDASSESIPHG